MLNPWVLTGPPVRLLEARLDPPTTTVGFRYFDFMNQAGNKVQEWLIGVIFRVLKHND